MARVLVLGGNGMLGHAVIQELLTSGHQVTATCRNHASLGAIEHLKQFGPLDFQIYEPLFESPPDMRNFQYAINCIGVIKPRINDNPADSIRINSVLPWTLTEAARQAGCGLIHVTTDCVFSGKDGGYTESSPHDCLDVYGKTKSLGEPDMCMTIRTSIIGREAGKPRSFLEWVISQDRYSTVKGFINHTWNGVTTGKLGNIMSQIIGKELYRKGIYHVFSREAVTKYELVRLVSNKFGKNLIINKVKTDEDCYRHLATEEDLNDRLVIPDIPTQIQML